MGPKKRKQTITGLIVKSPEKSWTEQGPLSLLTTVESMEAATTFAATTVMLLEESSATLTEQVAQTRSKYSAAPISLESELAESSKEKKDMPLTKAMLLEEK